MLYEIEKKMLLVCLLFNVKNVCFCIHFVICITYFLLDDVKNMELGLWMCHFLTLRPRKIRLILGYSKTQLLKEAHTYICVYKYFQLLSSNTTCATVRNVLINIKSYF